ncbi:MAG: PIN domain-containing protein [Actinomycetota bacterium]
MALTHLVDTSALTRLRDFDVRARILEGASQSVLAITSLSHLELGFSARSAQEWDEIAGSLQSLRAVEIVDTDVQSALRVQRELAARGLRGRKLVDLLISATALRLRLAVLHYDKDFDHISAVTGQVCEWVAPAGSLD